MAAITRERDNQFRVKLDELTRGGVPGLGRRAPTQVDPYLVGRAIAEVMRACSARTAAGSLRADGGLAPIAVFDSRNVSVGQGLIVREAARAARGGAGHAETLAVAAGAASRARLYAAVPSLDPSSTTSASQLPYVWAITLSSAWKRQYARLKV